MYAIVLQHVPHYFPRYFPHYSPQHCSIHALFSVRRGWLSLALAGFASNQMPTLPDWAHRTVPLALGVSRNPRPAANFIAVPAIARRHGLSSHKAPLSHPPQLPRFSPCLLRRSQRWNPLSSPSPQCRGRCACNSFPLSVISATKFPYPSLLRRHCSAILPPPCSQPEHTKLEFSVARSSATDI